MRCAQVRQSLIGEGGVRLDDNVVPVRIKVVLGVQVLNVVFRALFVQDAEAVRREDVPKRIELSSVAEVHLRSISAHLSNRNMLPS